MAQTLANGGTDTPERRLMGAESEPLRPPQLRDGLRAGVSVPPPTNRASASELDYRDDQDRDDVRDLDHRVDRRAGRVLVGIADRVTGHRGFVRRRAFAPVGAVLDQLLRVVPGAAAGGHADRGEEAYDDDADQEAAERVDAE